MQKPYDVKELVSKLKGRGLDLAEDAAKIVLEESLDFIKESAELSPSPYDNIVSVIIPMVKVEALKAIDKIDGQVG